MLHKGCGTARGLFVCATFCRQNAAYPEYAMLGSNQWPPHCRLGQNFPGRHFRVGKHRIHKRFLALLASWLSCSVQLRRAPATARSKQADAASSNEASMPQANTRGRFHMWEDREVRIRIVGAWRKNLGQRDRTSKPVRIPTPRQTTARKD